MKRFYSLTLLILMTVGCLHGQVDKFPYQPYSGHEVALPATFISDQFFLTRKPYMSIVVSLPAGATDTLHWQICRSWSDTLTYGFCLPGQGYSVGFSNPYLEVLWFTAKRSGSDSTHKYQVTN